MRFNGGNGAHGFLDDCQREVSRPDCLRFVAFTEDYRRYQRSLSEFRELIDGKTPEIGSICSDFHGFFVVGSKYPSRLGDKIFED